MVAVGIKVLKNRLSEYVRIAAGGERVLVLDRERVVAELGPPAPDRPLRAADAWMQELVRTGRITPALHRERRSPRSFPGVAHEQLMRDLNADREDR